MAQRSNLFQRYTHWLHGRWPAGLVEKSAEVAPDGTTNIPGIRITGDLTGIPLLKFAVDSGARAVQEIMAEPAFRNRAEEGADILDLAIIGAGPAGIAAAMEAGKAGLAYELFEAKKAFATIIDFPRGKPIHTYPSEMTPAGDFQVTATVKEALYEEMEAQRKTAAIAVTPRRVDHIQRKDNLIHLHFGDGHGPVKARRAIIAIGKSGNYRKLDCPGEALDKVFNRLHDPAEYRGRRVLVVGGGDSALESAIALAQNGARVVLSYRKKTFSRPKPENIEKLAALGFEPAAASAEVPPGRILTAMETSVQAIEESSVVLSDSRGSQTRIDNDVVFTMIGREAPLSFFRRSNIRLRGEGTLVGRVALVLFMLLCTFIYTWKAGGFTETWLDPWPWNMPNLIGGLGDWFAARVADRSTLIGTAAVSLQSRSFYYTLLYSLCVVIFGIARINRRRTPYVRRQTLTLMVIQVLPLFLLPEIILPWLGYNGLFTGGLGRVIADNLFELYIPAADYVAGNWPAWGHPRAYWRAYGFILAWPLMVYNVFADQPMGWWLVISLVQTFVIIPLLVFFYGKGAYCGWICPCGALAETMGDQQRTKMPHGPFWNRVNMLGQVILWIAGILLVIRIGDWLFPQSWAASSFALLLDGKNSQGQIVNPVSYKWMVDILIGGILGVGFYFKYSGRVWCRFACPLAALMHIYARFSRFRIFSDKKKCISCNACTTNCHQGIDIMNFANKGEPMADPECVRCSACVQVCPTGVLTFGRFTGDGRIKPDKLAASPVQLREKEGHDDGRASGSRQH